MSAETVRRIIERLEALPPSIEGDRDMLAWLRSEQHRRVRLVDFDTSADNALHVTWEWKLKPPARKGNRTDVMFLVNRSTMHISRSRGISELILYRQYQIQQIKRLFKCPDKKVNADLSCQFTFFWDQSKSRKPSHYPSFFMLAYRVLFWASASRILMPFSTQSRISCARHCVLPAPRIRVHLCIESGPSICSSV